VRRLQGKGKASTVGEQAAVEAPSSAPAPHASSDTSTTATAAAAAAAAAEVAAAVAAADQAQRDLEVSKRQLKEAQAALSDTQRTLADLAHTSKQDTQQLAAQVEGLAHKEVEAKVGEHRSQAPCFQVLSACRQAIRRHGCSVPMRK
jgi:septal ring factor EnvC (AmiA/AmiB activator)